MNTAANELDRATRAYLRERLSIAGTENTGHALDCVRTFIEAALLSELRRLTARTLVAEAEFLADGK
jgi:hypothetical protein